MKKLILFILTICLITGFGHNSFAQNYNGKQIRAVHNTRHYLRNASKTSAKFIIKNRLTVASKEIYKAGNAGGYKLKITGKIYAALAELKNNNFKKAKQLAAQAAYFCTLALKKMKK